MYRTFLFSLFFLVSFISRAQTLPNDDCANATELTVGYLFNDAVISATTLGCTASGLNPIPSCSNFGEGQDIWFFFHVPDSGSCTIETRENGGMNDTAISIYEGSCLSLMEITCDDDAGVGYMSKATVSGRTPGEILFIRLFDYQNNEFGSFDISVYNSDGIPPNNTPENARFITCGETVSGATINALPTEGIEDCDEYPVNPSLVPDVWYKWMGDGSRIILSTCNDADFDTSIGVYTGSPEALSCLNATDDHAGCDIYTTIHEFYSEPDVLYYIRVYGYQEDSIGFFDLTMDCLDSCAPPYINVAAVFQGDTNAFLSWDIAHEEISWQVEYGLTGFELGAGTTVNVTEPELLLTDLVQFSSYDYYVKSICEEGTSLWSDVVTWHQAEQTLFMHDGYINTCIPSLFLDSGGINGNYQNNEEPVFICFPNEEGRKMQVEFIAFDCGDSSDYLEIYDGEDDAAPLLISSSEVGNAGMITTIKATNESGALTFLFDSDSENTASGWEAIISCYATTSISDIIDREVFVYQKSSRESLLVEANEIINEITIQDYLGKRLFVKQVNKLSDEIDISSLNQGVYMVQVGFSDAVILKKFIKE